MSKYNTELLLKNKNKIKEHLKILHILFLLKEIQCFKNYFYHRK